MGSDLRVASPTVGSVRADLRGANRRRREVSTLPRPPDTTGLADGAPARRGASLSRGARTPKLRSCAQATDPYARTGRGRRRRGCPRRGSEAPRRAETLPRAGQRANRVGPTQERPPPARPSPRELSPPVECAPGQTWLARGCEHRSGPPDGRSRARRTYAGTTRVRTGDRSRDRSAAPTGVAGHRAGNSGGVRTSATAAAVGSSR